MVAQRRLTGAAADEPRSAQNGCPRLVFRVTVTHRTISGRHDLVAPDRSLAPGNVCRSRRIPSGRGDRLVSGGARPRRLAPYLREGVAEVRPFAKLFGAELALDKVAGVRTHAELDAPPARTPQKLPVLVFSHGYTGMPSSYTALLEDLASHGYAVLSVVHPYEASAATLADGRVVSMNGTDGKFRQGIQDVLGGVGPRGRDDGRGDARDRSTAEQERLLRGYLGTLHQTGVALRRWVDDTKLVLDRLSGLPAKSAASRLAARLDLSRIGAFGHSMGGVTAAQFCVEDRALPGGAESRRHPAVRPDDRHADAEAVPDGLLGAARAKRRERPDLPPRRRARTTGSTCGIRGTSSSATWCSGAGRCANARCWAPWLPRAPPRSPRSSCASISIRSCWAALAAAGRNAAVSGSHSQDHQEAEELF